MWSQHTSRTLSSLRYRNFRLLWFGTALSHTGDFMQMVAQSWLVWELTDSAFLLGVVGFFQAVPRLLLGAVSGVVVDRTDRRRLLLLTQTLAMAQAFVFWALVYFDSVQFWHIVLLVLFLGSINTLNHTGRQSLIHILVPREQIVNAVALNSSVTNFTKIIGPSLAGILISVIGIAGCLFINALSFAAIIVSLMMLELPPWQNEKSKGGFWQELTQGYRYVRANDRVFAALLLAYVVALLGSPYSRFLPIFATDILHVGPAGYGLLLSAPGLGAMISGLSLASLGNVRRRGYLLFASVLSFSIFLVLFTFSRSMAISLGCLILVGCSQLTFRVLANATVQTETPPHLLGRTLSLLFMDKGLWSFGTIFIGSMASLMGIAWAIVLSACICAIAAAFLLYRSVKFRVDVRSRFEPPLADQELHER